MGGVFLVGLIIRGLVQIVMKRSEERMFEDGVKNVRRV
jgi:hypothetical protein